MHNDVIVVTNTLATGLCRRIGDTWSFMAGASTYTLVAGGVVTDYGVKIALSDDAMNVLICAVPKMPVVEMH